MSSAHITCLISFLNRRIVLLNSARYPKPYLGLSHLFPHHPPQNRSSYFFLLQFIFLLFVCCSTQFSIFNHFHVSKMPTTIKGHYKMLWNEMEDKELIALIAATDQGKLKWYLLANSVGIEKIDNLSNYNFFF